MSELQDAISEKEKLYARVKEVSALVDTISDGRERMQQVQRLKVLRDMYRDACERVTRLQPLEKKKPRKESIKSVHTDSGTWNFFERSGLVWSDLGGYSWNTLGKLYEEADGNNARLLITLVSRAKKTLTERQSFYMDQCFNEHKTISKVAEENQVNRSSVSRVLRAGLKRLENFVISFLYAFQCIENDAFDHLRWASTTEVLTERQRELLYYLLSADATYSMIADKLELAKSTVCRTNGRIVDRIDGVSSTILEMPSANTIYRKEWRNRSEDEVAAMLGISKATYYRHVCRNQTVGGISRFAYECLRRKNRSAQDVANEFGCRPSTIRKYWREYSDVDIDSIEEPTEYIPSEVKRRNSIDLRNLLSRADDDRDTIGASISAETYMKMLKISSPN